jgi:hypothetical protein
LSPKALTRGKLREFTDIGAMIWNLKKILGEELLTALIWDRIYSGGKLL